jgi:hypothetical protein
MFHVMHKEYPVVWEKLLRGCGPHFFWDQAPPDDPRLAGHPVRDMEGYRERAVPLVLHGDGAQYTTHGDSIKTLQWSILGSQRAGSSWDYVFMIIAFVSSCAAKKDVDGVDTWEVIYGYVMNSFNTLLLGIFPQRTPARTDWPADSLDAALAAGIEGDFIADGRFVGFLYAVTADLEYLSNDLRLEHFNSVSFCWGCSARQDNGPLNFRNAHPEAPWRGTMVSPEGCAFDNGHPLWDAAGLSRFSVVGDWMHSGHLGVLPIVIGGAFEELASGYEGNSAEQAAALWNDVQRKHRELGLQKLVYTLTGSMFPWIYNGVREAAPRSRRRGSQPLACLHSVVP